MPTPVPDWGLPPASARAKVYETPNRSGSITFRIVYSIAGSKKRFQSGFDTRQKADQFLQMVNDKFEAGKTTNLTDLAGVYRHELLAGIEKLKVAGATFTQAVDFYLKFAKPVHGDFGPRGG